MGLGYYNSVSYIMDTAVLKLKSLLMHDIGGRRGH